MSVFVQFTDAGQLAICSVFAERQRDEDVWPNQGVVEDDDPRYVSYMTARGMLPADPDPGGIARAWRDAEIARVTWLRDRHRDEIEMGVETTLTAEQYADLLAYIKALRDWPASIEFPAEDSRPLVPDWVATQTQ